MYRSRMIELDRTNEKLEDISDIAYLFINYARLCFNVYIFSKMDVAHFATSVRYISATFFRIEPITSIYQKFVPHFVEMSKQRRRI